MSALGKLRSFAEAREAADVPIRDGLSYGDARELLRLLDGNAPPFVVAVGISGVMAHYQHIGATPEALSAVTAIAEYLMAMNRKWGGDGLA